MTRRTGNCPWRSQPRSIAAPNTNRSVSRRRTSFLRFIGRPRSVCSAISTCRDGRFIPTTRASSSGLRGPRRRRILRLRRRRFAARLRSPATPNFRSRAPYVSFADWSAAAFTLSSPTALSSSHGSGLTDRPASAPNLNWWSPERGMPAPDSCSRTSGGTQDTSGRSRTRARPGETCTTSSATARPETARSSVSRRSATPYWASPSAMTTLVGVPRGCGHAGPS